MTETAKGHAVERLTAYELQVLLGTSISGCVMSLDRTFDLPSAWQRLYKFGLIDRADGIAIATEKGLALINRALSAPIQGEAKRCPQCDFGVGGHEPGCRHTVSADLINVILSEHTNIENGPFVAVQIAAALEATTPRKKIVEPLYSADALAALRAELAAANARAEGQWAGWVKEEVARKAADAEVARLKDETGWQPGPPPDNVGYVDVREVTTYRFKPYKADGRRQMGTRGRWQSATEYGFENCDQPTGEWRLNKPDPRSLTAAKGG